MEKAVVVSIDIGTRSSVWVFSLRNDYMEDPLYTCLAHHRVPTTVLFDETRNFHSFGSDAEAMFEKLQMKGDCDKWYYFKRFKAKLYDKEVRLDTEVEDVNNKQMKLLTVYAATIEFIINSSLQRITRRIARKVSQHEVYWVIIVPAIWSNTTREFMVTSALKAGLGAEQVSVISEPEAAFLYCQSYSERCNTSVRTARHTPGNKHIVLNLGAHKTDITVLETRSENGLKELHKTYGPWGGTKIDEEFNKFLFKLLGQSAFDKLLSDSRSDYVDLLNAFHMKKSTIIPQATGTIHLNTTPVIKRACKQSKRSSKYNKVITWHGNVMKIDAEFFKSFFQPYCQKIVSHVKYVLKGIAVQGTGVLMMVGTSSMYKIVSEEILKTFPSMSIIIPEDMIFATLTGAVIYGHRGPSKYVQIETAVNICYGGMRTAVGILPEEILRMDTSSVELYRRALTDGQVTAYNIRLMVVGHFGVGKTTLTKRLFDEEVDLKQQSSTDGIDVHVRKCRVSLQDGHWNIYDQESLEQTEASMYLHLAQVMGTQILHTSHSSECSITNKCEGELEQDDSDTSEECEAIDKDEIVAVQFDLGAVDDFVYSEEDEDIVISLQELLKEAENADTDDIDKMDTTAALSLWDFAGQYAFYSTHQVFLSKRAIYLLVTDMSKDIDGLVGDTCYTDSSGTTSHRVSEFVEFWLNSIHEFCQSSESGEPPVVLVGTFADKLDQTRLEELKSQYFYSLRRKFVHTEAAIHVSGHDFMIDNTVADDTIEQLRKAIWQLATEQSHWGEVIPAKWLTLESALIKLQSNGRKVLDKGVFLDLNKSLPVPITSENELDLFLTFHHETGNIIYFSGDNLKEHILLDPQWLIDAFRCLITAKTFCSKQPPDVFQKWLKLDELGILTKELVDVVWQDGDYFKYKDLLLYLMEKLHLIARPIQVTGEDAVKLEDFYFVPGVLKVTPPRSIFETDSNLCTRSSSLCLTTKSNFLPITVFHKLLAACLSRWEIYRRNQRRQLYCGCGLFKMGATHILHVYYCDNCIQIWIVRYSSTQDAPSRDVCIEARQFIEDSLKNASQLTSEIELCVKCPTALQPGNCSMIKLQDLLDNDEVLCSSHDLEHLVRSSDLTSCWTCRETVPERSFVTPAVVNQTYRLPNRTPTDKDINRMAQHIGQKYRSLGLELGLSLAEMENIQEDNITAVDRINAMLIKWRRINVNAATFAELASAMDIVGVDTESVLHSVL